MDVNEFVADKIKQFRINHNMTQDELAEALGITSQTISRYENGDRKPTNDTLFQLSKLFRISINDFFPSYDNAEYTNLASDPVRIDILGSIKAGTPMEAQDDIIGHRYISRDMTKGGREFYALKISGDSMSPKYKDGDVVVFEHTMDIERANGRDCAVMVNNTECTFKKVFINNNGIVLQPYNSDYEAKIYSADDVISLPISIVGIAVEKIVKI